MSQGVAQIQLCCSSCGSRYTENLFANHNGKRECDCGRPIPPVLASLKSSSKRSILTIEVGEGMARDTTVFSGPLDHYSSEKEFKF